MTNIWNMTMFVRCHWHLLVELRDLFKIAVKNDSKNHNISREKEKIVLAVDHIILCSGQISQQELYEELKNTGSSVHLIGGALLAAELDAKKAIRDGAELAAKL